MMRVVDGIWAMYHVEPSQTIKSIFSFKTIKLKQLERLNRSEAKFLLENLR